MFRRWSATSRDVTVTHDMISYVCGVWQCGVQGNECGDVSEFVVKCVNAVLMTAQLSCLQVECDE